MQVGICNSAADVIHTEKKTYAGPYGLQWAVLLKIAPT
jgi:hypothetical protein